MMSSRILFVDDDPAALDGYRRLLHKDFLLDTAVHPREALQKFETASYAVVVSDMQMPGMDGVQLLNRIREISADTVPIILTGFGDIDAAVSAVNEGHVFRFLLKPCQNPVLAKALNAGLLQHRLITAERDLLESTLSGAVQVLVEVLSLVNPAAFNRAMRLRDYVRQMAAARKLEGIWRFEIAAMLSQLGCVTLDPETLDAVNTGRPLSAHEQAKFRSHPYVGRQLLAKIPRLETVAAIIARQQDPQSLPGDTTRDPVEIGGQMLRTALAYDNELCAGSSEAEALGRLRACPGEFPSALVDALYAAQRHSQTRQARQCDIEDLACGMTLNEDIRMSNGLLLFAKGQDITPVLLERLKNFSERRLIEESVAVLCSPVQGSGPVAESRP